LPSTLFTPPPRVDYLGNTYHMHMMIKHKHGRNSRK
jgi:hypothetical protein